MLFLVDGYNITRADDATRRLPLDEQREALVRRLKARGREMLGEGRIVVVFDGRPDAGERAADAGPDVEVVFARGESADDLLTRLAAASEEPVTLVSSDRELKARVKAAARHVAHLRSSSSAWESAGKGRDRKGGRGRGRFPASTAGLPGGANRITEELKRIWLSEEDASGEETEHGDGGREREEQP